MNVNLLIESIINNDCQCWKRPWHTYGNSPVIWSADDIWYTKSAGKNFLQSIRINYKFCSDVWISSSDVYRLNGTVKQGQLPYMFDTSHIKKKKTKHYSNNNLVSLYNLDQVSNVQLKSYYNKQYNNDCRNLLADSLIKNCDVVILECGAEPAMWLDDNVCQMPFWNQFNNSGDYYATVFHEIGHWCKRYDHIQVEDDKLEEIVAELTSMKLCEHFNINYNVQSSYNYISVYLSGRLDDINSILQQANTISLNRLNNCLQYNL